MIHYCTNQQIIVMISLKDTRSATSLARAIAGRVYIYHCDACLVASCMVRVVVSI